MTSYDEIYNRMKQEYQKRTGIEVADASDTGIRFAVLADEVYSLLCNCDWLKRQMFADTASGEALDLHAEQRELTRKTAAKSEGRVKFFINEAAERSITIEKGTVVSTDDTTPVSFVTTETAVIRAGAFSATAAARALHGGKNGNAAAGKINIIVTSAPYVDGVTNTEAFKGGTDAESDERLRRRITESYRNISNGTNKAYYKTICEKIDGVGSVGVIPKNRGVGTVDVFLAGQTTTVGADAVAEANRILKAAREVNVDARAFAAEEQQVSCYAYVTVDKLYDKNEVAQLCKSSIVELIENAGIGEDILISQIISRLMSLDGVKDVRIPINYVSTIIDDNAKATVGQITIDPKTEGEQ